MREPEQARELPAESATHGVLGRTPRLVTARVGRAERRAAVGRGASVEVDRAIAVVVEAVLTSRVFRPSRDPAARIGGEVDPCVSVVVDPVVAGRRLASLTGLMALRVRREVGLA